MGPIAQSTIRTSLVLGLRLLIQAGTLLLVARLLGPNDFGLFAGIAALAVLMGTFSTFGTHLVLLGEVSKDHTKCNHILRYAVPTTLIVGSLIFCLYIAISFLLFNQLNPSLVLMICIGLTEIILLPLFGLSTIEELALGKTAYSQLLIIFPLGLRTLAVIMVLLVHPAEPLIFFAWLYLISALFVLGYRKFYKSNAWLKVSQWRLPNKQELKNSAGYAVLALTATGPGELDKMLAVKLLPLGLSGVYVAASRVIGAAALPIMALLLSAMPRLFRTHSELKLQSSRLNCWIIASALIYSFLVASLLWFFAPGVEWLFGSQYQGMTEILRWLCLVMPAFLLRITLANILMTMNKLWFRAAIESLGMLILIISAIMLYAHLDLLAIVLALALSEWGMVGASLVCVFYKYLQG